MIELVQVSFRRGQQCILDGAFIHVDGGQVVLISGPSGIGKTTLLSLLGGFTVADEGEVKVFGHDVARMRASSTALLRRKIAFVPQELELVDDLSAIANVRLALEVCGAPRRVAKRRAAEALAAVDLAEFIDRPVCSLSTGQRRRVCLARGLVRDADLFVADEPSNDLDGERVLRLVDLVDAMREEGKAIVMATNDPRLLTHSQQSGWRHLDLCQGQLVPGGISSLFRRAGDGPASQERPAAQAASGVDDVPAVAEADPPASAVPPEQRMPDADTMPNVVPFPISVAMGARE